MADEKNVSTGGEEPVNEELAVIDPIYQKYVKSILRSLGSTSFYQFFMDSWQRAENEIQFSNRRMEKIVDLRWVEAIEDSLKGMQNIVASPRNIIREDELIVNVANAKKAGSDVVQHLAMHASFVEKYEPETGDVRPSKLMQKYREDSVGKLYENRVAYTVLEMAHQFVSHRYEALFQVMGEEFGAKLKVCSDLETATEAVHMDTFIHIRDVDSALDIDAKNRDCFDRIARLQRILTSLMGTQFARHMSKVARVKGPLTKTNMLKKDPNYKVIAKLWDFLHQYQEIGYAIKIVEQNPVIDENFQRDIFHNILFNYLVLKGHLERDKDRRLPEPMKERKRKIKPKFVKEIIEELTEDYDLPEVEIRKVLIEELTKEQLMQEEAEERRRLVEEQERRKREEAERIRQEKEAEEERKRLEREAEKERIRLEKEAERERLERERMERELETIRRGSLFRNELAYFSEHLQRHLDEREEEAAREREEQQSFEDAARILEETERLKQEELERERQRQREERERLAYEKRLAEEQARREEGERLERERREREEREERERREREEREERERKEREEREERERREREEREERERREREEREERERREQHERDVAAAKPYTALLEALDADVSARLAQRRLYAEQLKAEQEARERERQKRLSERKSSKK